MIRYGAEGIELVVRWNGEQPAVSARGAVDTCTAPLFLSCLLQVAGQATTDIVVDLSDTTFLDCRGLAALMATRDALQMQGRSLVVRRARGIVRKILAMSDLADLLHDRPDHALGPPAERRGGEHPTAPLSRPRPATITSTRS